MGSHRGGNYSVADTLLRQAASEAAASDERVRQHDLARMQAPPVGRVSIGGATIEPAKCSITLRPDELKALSNLIGCEWHCVAGRELKPDFATDGEVVVATTTDSVCLRAEAAEIPFPYDVPMTYSVLTVSGDTSTFEAAQRRGNLYVQHQRKRVSDVRVVRETITATEIGSLVWEYTTDIGVVFVLSDGAVVVSKGSHHTGKLAVGMAPGPDQFVVPGLAIEWSDDLTIQHGLTRTFIPVERLI